MLNPNLSNIYLTQTEYYTYSKHFILDKIGLQGQKRLKHAKVLIIGAGGLGCPALIYLVSTGIGTIGIIDQDYIEISNLNRQILYTITNINLEKTIVAKKRLLNINPKCKIITYTQKFQKQNSLNIISHYDLILDCCDNFNTRYIIDTACYNLHKIHIYGAVNKFEGQLSVFNYNNGLRYSDIYLNNIIQTNFNNNCNNNGVLSSITGIIGILQASEAIKIILGIGEIITGKLLTYNLLNHKIKIIPIYKKNINKNNNLKINLVKNIYYTQSINKSIHKLIIIDIRNIHEFKRNHFKYAMNIPLIYLDNQTTINFIKKHLINKIILIYCKSQSRSKIAHNLLIHNHIKSMIIKK